AGSPRPRPGGSAGADRCRAAGPGRAAGPAGSRQAGGQAESREQADVDEVVMPDDPVAGDLDDLDAPRLVPAFGARLIGAERGAAVGRGGDQARAAASAARADEE